MQAVQGTAPAGVTASNSAANSPGGTPTAITTCPLHAPGPHSQ